MSSFAFDDGGAVGRLAADLIQTGVKAGVRAVAVTRHFGMLLQTQVKANAAGRPGPRIQTGDYNRSISLRTGTEGASPIASVGTNRPQGPRLEFGFIGEDALGRTYNQDPLPHFGPAADKIGPLFEAALADQAVELGPISQDRQRDSKGRYL